MGNEENGCAMDEEKLREIIREELDGAIEEFTDQFYANVGRSIVRRALVVVGLVIVYLAFKSGALELPTFK